MMSGEKKSVRVRLEYEVGEDGDMRIVQRDPLPTEAELLRAENAELKRQVEEVRTACDEFYDAVLHDRHQLAEEGMTCEQTNSVLGIYDDTIGNVLSTTTKGESE